MSNKLGMSPDDVEQVASQLNGARGLLDYAQHTASNAADVSLNPVTYLIQPGGILIAPWAIVGTKTAAAQVRAALHNVDALIGQLHAEVHQQRHASDAYGGGLPAAERGLILLPPPASATPARNKAWWDSLSPDQREAIINEHPDWIGNLEGIPYSDRDTANRAILDQCIATATGDDLVAYRNIKESLGDQSSAPKRQLIELTNDHPPLAAVSIGNLDTASNATFLVPGMSQDTKTMTTMTSAALNLYNDQCAVAPGQTQAVVAWIGYKTPTNPVEVFRGEMARDGAERLNTALEGYNANRPAGAALNVVGHSYGSTTSADALASQDNHVNSFVTLGSAGLEQKHASDLDVGRVYAGQGKETEDGLAGLGQVGSLGRTNPKDSEFGAQVIGTSGSAGLKESTVHSVYTDNPGETGYLNPGTEALRNTAYATTGQGDACIR